MSLLVIFLCWIISSFFIQHFIVVTEHIDLARSILFLCGIDFGIKLIDIVFSGMLFGLQQFYIKNFIDIIIIIITNLIIYTFLSRGYGILCLLTIIIVFDLLKTAILFIACKKVYPSMEFKLSSVNKESFRTLLSFASKVFTSSSLSRIAYNADPIIISYFLSPVWTTIFSIPQRLVRYVKQTTWSLTAIFLPVFSDLDKRKDLDGLQTIYFNYTRYILIALLPLIVAVSVYGILFISLWVGESYAQKSNIVFYLLLGSMFVNFFQPLDQRLFMGTNKLNIMVIFSAASSILNVTLSIILVKPYGINGIAFATLITIFFLRISYLFLAFIYYDIGIPKYIYLSTSSPIFCSAFYGAALLFIKSKFSCNSYYQIILQVMACLPIYILISYFFSLKSNEKAYGKELIRNKLSIISIKKIKGILNNKKILG
ncbi:MAG: oligosaccharide flippase family protein [bacterium]